MEQQLKLFRVFIASPGDLGDERRALRDVVEKIHAIFSKETEWRIELLGWEDTLPGAGRPQELINADLDKADLFIGCLWQRWGSSSGIDGKTWAIWDSRSLPAKRLAISSAHAIDSLGKLIGA